MGYTPVLEKLSEKAALDALQNQLGTLKDHLSNAQQELNVTPTGSKEWLAKAEVMRQLGEQIEALEAQLPKALEAAKTEAEKKREAEAKQAAILLEKQAKIDLEAIEKLCQRINGLSDQLSESVQQFYAVKPEVWQRLAATKKLRVSANLPSSIDQLLNNLFYVVDIGATGIPSKHFSARANAEKAGEGQGLVLRTPRRW